MTTVQSVYLTLKLHVICKKNTQEFCLSHQDRLRGGDNTQLSLTDGTDVTHVRGGKGP